jgi:hypothetical protein
LNVISSAAWFLISQDEYESLLLSNTTSPLYNFTRDLSETTDYEN